jgi:hypothetical protein
MSGCFFFFRAAYRWPMLRLRAGLRCTIGVSFKASRCRTWIRRPSIAAMTTSCRPIGFGRSGDRVLNTPFCGLDVSPLGCTDSTSRRARSSQVIRTISSPGRRLFRPSATSASKISHAAGAPSSGCLEADPGCVNGDSTFPIAFIARLVISGA